MTRYVISANVIVEADSEDHARELADDMLDTLRYKVTGGWDDAEVSVLDVFAEDTHERETFRVGDGIGPRETSDEDDERAMDAHVKRHHPR